MAHYISEDEKAGASMAIFSLGILAMAWAHLAICPQFCRIKSVNYIMIPGIVMVVLFIIYLASKYHDGERPVKKKPNTKYWQQQNRTGSLIFLMRTNRKIVDRAWLFYPLLPGSDRSCFTGIPGQHF